MITDLPRNWYKTTIGEVFIVTLGQSPPSSTYNDHGEGLPFFQGKAEFDDVYPVTRKWCGSPKKIAQKGDILLSVRAPVGPTNIANTKCCIGRGLASIRPVDGIDNKFILHFFRSVERYLAKIGTGTTFNAITGDKLKGFQISLPPLPEQHRIVGKIEELFTKLDKGIESLKQAQAQLKRYRQSVLKAAVEGRLTAKWRELGKDEFEPADKLLERILQERRYKWEAEKLAKYKSKGKKPPKNWQDKYKEPTPPDTTDLPELPEGWVLLTVEMISEWSNGKGLTKKQIMAGEYPVFGGNGINGYHNSYLSKSECIVVGRVGAHCGNIHIAPNKSWITDNAIYTKWISRLSNIQFVGLALSNKNLNKISGGSGQPYVSQSLLNPLQIALPSLDEQNQIIVDIMREYSIIDEVEKTIEIELIRSQSLRQSILKRAFEGKLVPQDPNYLPAPQPGKYYIYVLECSNGSYYIGQTENIEKRWCAHTGGKGADWTRKYPPVALVHWEEYNSRANAAKREKELKTGFGRKWIKREIKAGRLRQAGEPASVLLERIKSEKAKYKKSKQMEI